MEVTDMEKVDKVYKALQETPKGKLISLRAQSGDGRLEYKEGEITYASEKSLGVFVSVSLEGARVNGEGNRHYCDANGGNLVIYEAIPLGKLMDKTGGYSSSQDRYPAILLGKEVWREKPKPSTEEWVKHKEAGYLCLE